MVWSVQIATIWKAGKKPTVKSVPAHTNLWQCLLKAAARSPSPNSPEDKNLFSNSYGFYFSTWALGFRWPLRQPQLIRDAQSRTCEPAGARRGRRRGWGWIHHGTTTAQPQAPAPAAPGSTSSGCLSSAFSAFYSINQWVLDKKAWSERCKWSGWLLPPTPSREGFRSVFSPWKRSGLAQGCQGRASPRAQARALPFYGNLATPSTRYAAPENFSFSPRFPDK